MPKRDYATDFGDLFLDHWHLWVKVTESSAIYVEKVLVLIGTLLVVGVGPRGIILLTGFSYYCSPYRLSWRRKRKEDAEFGRHFSVPGPYAHVRHVGEA